MKILNYRKFMAVYFYILYTTFCLNLFFSRKFNISFRLNEILSGNKLYCILKLYNCTVKSKFHWMINISQD